MILGIESSCDDSSIALMDENSLKLNYFSKISQEIKHAKFGGVVPELAARLHTKALPEMIEKIKPYFSEISAIAVTNEPGLSVSLIGGVSMAKALSISLNKPLIAVNHLVGHIFSVFLDKKEIFPLGVLLVSGGHTLVLDISANGKISVLAKTDDDSFGESFDKVAKMLGLDYPGGALIENLAKNCDGNLNFTVPLLHDKRLEYSFSGLKNQVRMEIEKAGETSQSVQENIAASFQKTAIAHIMDKLSKIYEMKKWQNFAVVGGASANSALRTKLENLANKYGSTLHLAPLKFCSDNAAMIARAGVYKYNKKEFINYKNLDIVPHLNYENFKI